MSASQKTTFPVPPFTMVC